AQQTGQPHSTQESGPTLEEIQASIRDNITQQQARQEAINQRIEQRAQVWAQNFYYAEAISSGKQNLAELSRLSGNYNSVAELEAEFNQKSASIQAEVNSLQQARNAQLSNAANGYFNEGATEKAVAQSMQQIGNIVNHHKAQKEAREAHLALQRERQQKLAAMEAARKRAIQDLRNKLVSSFPDGGTPISSHKVAAEQVYLFAYITDKNSFGNEHASVAISNVFPVQRYSDGTYPYKTTVVNKLQGFGAGNLTLVGYYTDRQKAEEMRTSFLNLAQKSNLRVQPITYTPAKTSASQSQTKGDFWENGQQTNPTQKKDDFWNN
ncbi:MAG: hypothetical protein LPK03_10435, partial [Pontibacter sp.]|nr:hypothetical protein [Pontibacter sp.]